MRRLALTLAAALASGCSLTDARTLVAALPEDVVWLALLVPAEDGSVGEATGIVRRDGDATTVVLERPAGALRVVGWSERDLEPAGPLPAEDVLARERLRLAAPGEARLPTPSWSVVGEGGGDAPIATTMSGAALALGASWLPACPVLAAEPVLADFACGACGAIVRQQGCRLTLEGTCTTGNLEGVVAGDGALALAGDGVSLSCRAGSSTVGEGLRYDCGEELGCLRLHPGAAPERFVVTELALSRDQTEVESPLRPRKPAPLVGHLPAMDRVGDELWVVESRSRPTDWSCAGAPVESVLHRVSTVGAPVVRTATLPPCTTQLVGGADGAWIVHGAPPQTVTRLDRELRARASVVLPAGPEPAAVVALARSGDSASLALAALPADAFVRPARPAAALVVLDAESLAVRLPPIIGVDTSLALAAFGPQGFVVFESDDAGGLTFDAAGDRVRLDARDPGCAPFDVGIAAAAAIDDRRLITASRSARPGLLVVEAEGPRCQRISAFEHDLEPSAVHVTAGARAIFGGVDRDGEAYAGELDLVRGEVLRGATPIGRGLVTRVVEDAGGAWWMLLPASGRVVRVVRR